MMGNDNNNIINNNMIVTVIIGTGCRHPLHKATLIKAVKKDDY